MSTFSEFVFALPFHVICCAPKGFPSYTIGNALAIGVAVGVVLVVGNVRPGWQLACRDKLVHDVAGEGFDHCDGFEL